MKTMRDKIVACVCQEDSDFREEFFPSSLLKSRIGKRGY